MSRGIGISVGLSINMLPNELSRDIRPNTSYDLPTIRPDVLQRKLWPSSRMMGGDTSAGGYMLGSDASNAVTPDTAYEFPVSMLGVGAGRGGYFLCGVTRDASGVALANCTILGFRVVDNSYQGPCVSGFSGEYCWVGQFTDAHYLVAYLPGAPDVAGTTVNTLTPSTTRTY